MLVSLHDKAQIAAYLAQDKGLHIYEYGDLDPFFWPHTVWYGWQEKSELKALALLYLGSKIPVILALDRQPERLKPLLQAIGSILPVRFYAHLSEGLEGCFKGHRPSGGERYLRMLRSEALAHVSEAQPLSPAEAEMVRAFFDNHYPQHWFETQMLQTNAYYGIYGKNQELISAGGVHVLSVEYAVAALGNIAVHQDFRGQGLGQNITAAICSHLPAEIDLIGLNVHQNNQAAVHCYQNLGFKTHALYREWLFES